MFFEQYVKDKVKPFSLFFVLYLSTVVDPNKGHGHLTHDF